MDYPRLKELAKLPEGTPEFMAGAYYGCLLWAIEYEPILKQFESETGVKSPLKKPRSPIEAMVDKACGMDWQKDTEEFIVKFKEWHDKNVWGDMNEPLPEGEIL